MLHIPCLSPLGCVGSGMGSGPLTIAPTLEYLEYKHITSYCMKPYKTNMLNWALFSIIQLMYLLCLCTMGKYLHIAGVVSRQIWLCLVLYVLASWPCPYA